MGWGCGSDQVQQILARRKHAQLRQHYRDVCSATRRAAVDSASVHRHTRAEPWPESRIDAISIYSVGWSRTTSAELVFESVIFSGQLQHWWGTCAWYEALTCITLRAGTDMRALQCGHWSIRDLLRSTPHHSWNERLRDTTQLTAYRQHRANGTWHATATTRHGTN